MNFSYKIKKIKIKFNRIFKKELVLDDIQQKAYKIVVRLINDQDSDLLIAPISKKKFIKNKDIFITLNREKVNIINGVYHYDIYIQDKVYEHLKDKFNKKLESKRIIMENQIKSNVKNSLDTILSNISSLEKSEH